MTRCSALIFAGGEVILLRDTWLSWREGLLSSDVEEEDWAKSLLIMAFGRRLCSGMFVGSGAGLARTGVCRDEQNL